MAANEKQLELKKHVGAIHSSNRLTLLQRKIANALLFNAYDNLLERDEHQIHIKVLCELVGYDSNDYKTIKKALVALISTVIEWNLVDKDRLDNEGIWNASAIIADASIDGPFCTYSYSNKMKKLLYRPELYGQLNMKVQARFKSSYGLALYENCIRFKNISQTPWLEMAVFRKLMGIGEQEYLIFRDFKRRVLDTAMREVNEFSPLRIMVKFRKEQRKVVALRFLLNATINPENTTVTLENKLVNSFGFSKLEAAELITQYGESTIVEKMIYVESTRSYRDGKIDHLAAYLKNALQHNYTPAKSSREQLQLAQTKKTDETKLRVQKEQQKELYRKYQDKEILARYHNLPDKQKEIIHKEFSSYIQGGLYFDFFLRDGLSNILVADRFCQFVRTQRRDLLEGTLSFAHFCVKPQCEISIQHDA